MLKVLILANFLFIVQLSAQNIRKGGFDYQWSNYSNDIYTGLGNRTIQWDSTDLVDIVHAPATGIHPRVYFGPSEIPNIKYRLDSTTSGTSIKASIHAHTMLLHLGIGYSQSQSYALDAFGNRYIDNSGAWNMAPFYTALKNQDSTVWDNATIKNKHRTAALMSLEAFMCLLYNGQTDPDLGGIAYSVRAQELADAMFFWAKLALNDSNVNPNGQNFNNFGGTHMALCYVMI